MGGIANDGKSINPYIVKKITSSNGATIKKASSAQTRLMSKENADKLTTMMRNNVKKNYGDYRFSGLEVCGKTGTAEVGDKSTPHSWFVGFCDNPNTPYAFTVIVENAGAGNGAATSIAATVLKKLK
jgi:peptidoglycan glycosyltransferase